MKSLIIICGGILGGLIGGIFVQDSQKRKMSGGYWKKIGLKSKISILCDYSIVVPFCITIGSGTMMMITKPF